MANIQIQKNVELELRNGEEVLLKVSMKTGKFLLTDSRYLIITNQRVVFALRSANPFLSPEQAKSKEETINFSDIAELKNKRGILGVSDDYYFKMKDGTKRGFRVWPPKPLEKMSKEERQEYREASTHIFTTWHAAIGDKKE